MLNKEIKQNESDDNSEKVEIIQENTKRDVILITICAIILFLIGTAIYGISKGNFQELSAVWSQLSPILLMILAYYVGTKNMKAI